MANTLSHMFNGLVGDVDIVNENEIHVSAEKDVYINEKFIRIHDNNKMTLLNPAHFKRALLVPNRPNVISVFFSDNYEHRFTGSDEFLAKLTATFRSAEKFNPKAAIARLKLHIDHEIKTPYVIGKLCDMSFKEIVRFEIYSDHEIMIHILQCATDKPQHLAVGIDKPNMGRVILNWVKFW